MAIKAYFRVRDEYDVIHLYTTYPSVAKPRNVLESLDTVVRNVNQPIPSHIANALLFSNAAQIAHQSTNDITLADAPWVTPERVDAFYNMGWKVFGSDILSEGIKAYDVYIEDYEAAIREEDKSVVRVRFADIFEQNVDDWDDVEWEWDKQVIDAVDEV